MVHLIRNRDSSESLPTTSHRKEAEEKAAREAKEKEAEKGREGRERGEEEGKKRLGRLLPIRALIACRVSIRYALRFAVCTNDEDALDRCAC